MESSDCNLGINQRLVTLLLGVLLRYVLVVSIVPTLVITFNLYIFQMCRYGVRGVGAS